MNYYNENTIIYFNGEYVKASEAKMDLYSQSLHYGYAVFEGIRSYKTTNGATRIFKEQEHFDRLQRSAASLNMPYSWQSDELIAITYEVLKRNNLQDAYIRPIVFAPANKSFSPNTESNIAIEVWEMQPFLGRQLLKVMTSSYQRPNPKGFNIEAKATGHYVNSILASQEAKAAGYHEALLTDMNDFVAEGPGANVFFEKEGRLFTPGTGNILPGITRSTVFEICRQLHLPVEEKLFGIEELKQADAAFFCGTAAEVIGWESLDDSPIPEKLGRLPEPAGTDLLPGTGDGYTSSTIKTQFNISPAGLIITNPIQIKNSMSEINRYSKTLTQDTTQPAAQAMLYGIGLTDNDLKKAQVGIASMGYDGNTCNMHLNDLAKIVKQSVWDNELVGLIFNTIGVSDGMSMGTDGMRYSLVSRDLIADSIETVCGAQYYDALIALPGCDKNMPGSVMAMGRLNRPSIMLYGGSIAPGHYKGQELNIVSAFEALGQKIAGQLNEADFKGIVKNACPGAGACGGIYTANTMSSAIEALGMSLPYSSSNPAISEAKEKECREVGKAIRLLMEKNIKPRDIMTRKAFDNAITIVMALGGSTNAVLHLIAIAKSIDIPLTQDDFQTIANKVPVLADLKPSGKYLMEDIHKIGGVPAVMKYLLSKGFLHGDCLTVTGVKPLQRTWSQFHH